VLRNVWFAGTKLIAIPCFLFYGWLTDRLGNRFYVCFTVMVGRDTALGQDKLTTQVWALVPCGILAVHPKNFNLMTFAWFMTDTFVITPILFPWFNEVCKANAEERAIVISTANLVFYIFNAWLPVVVFPQVEAPRFSESH
jgi:ACS family pantothenate transporter-like MFS transporter